MAQNVRLKYNGGIVYPQASLDNLVRNSSSSEPVQLPVLDSDGKILSTYIPDGLGGGASKAIISLGSAGAVTIEPGNSYIWDVKSSSILSANASSGMYAENAKLKINDYFDGVITGTGNAVLNGAISAGMRNECDVNFIGEHVTVTPVSSYYDYTVINSSTDENTVGTLAYALKQGNEFIKVNVSAFVDTDLSVYDACLTVPYDVFVSSGGKVKNVMFVGFNGGCFVYSGGSTEDIIIQGGGTSRSSIIFSGGFVNNILVNNGKLCVSSGGTAINVHENGGFVSSNGGASVSFIPNTFSGALISSGRSASLHSGTTGINLTVNSSGFVYVYSGGLINTATINTTGFIYVSSGGLVNDIRINSLGVLDVSYGGVASNVAPGSGCSCINRGGKVTFTNYSTGILYGYSDLTSSATSVSSISLSNWQQMYVMSDGVAEDITLNADNDLVYLGVYSGGTASNVHINYDDYNVLHVLSGGVAYVAFPYEDRGTIITESGATVVYKDPEGIIYSSYDYENDSDIFQIVPEFNNSTIGYDEYDNGMWGNVSVYSGGVANNITVNSDGAIEVYSGGLVNTAIVNSSGYIGVYSGGSAISTTINSGGRLAVREEAAYVDYVTVSSGGTLYIYNDSNINFDHVTSMPGAIIEYD